ncbi:MAG: Coenzyme F420-reducing hydrogenase beta subunit [Candidatus Methanohalarchaeum thermophilum]|uniref:Coenzyme F420-reducing hydrogenase beta subunit n=1 Tax=Methanohalarchaeum thermophilum TaxID=1903181 RepID=A0A1Q6DUC0_METT1|nr:MAG: Coenzyme F420-reducing hydrogenase beta subunit [Candidatus Methanohalarchaeum thermophilum]
MKRSGSLNYFELKKAVLDKEKCIRCGACIIACPIDSLVLDPYPKLVDKCLECGKCAKACPIVKKDGDGFDRKKAFAAKTKSLDILKNSQDGGVVTSILFQLFEKDKIDKAIVVGGENDLEPKAKIVSSKNELNKTAGTKYGLTPVISKLQDIKGSEDVAVVGTPCQSKAARMLKEMGFGIEYIIGVFCMQNFNSVELKNKFEKKGIKNEEIKDLTITNGKFQVNTKDDKKKLPISEFDSCVPRACSSCVDFEAKHADISIGSVGSEKDHSTVIIRTKKGKEMFELTKDKLEYIELNSLQQVDKLGTIKLKK